MSGISRSTDFGDTWKGIKITSSGWSNTSSSTKIKISLADPSIVWAGRSLLAGNGLMSVSQDSGKTFTEIPAATNTPPAYLSGFATSPVDKNTAYALFSLAHNSKIMRTTDLGQTWTDISGFGSNSSSSNGFPDVAVFSLLVMPNFPNVLWAGTEIGIFESMDNGATWHIANNGLPSVAVWEMKAFDNEIIVATHGRGIWTVPFLVTDVKENKNKILPNHFALEQNYPNPFNPSTTIKFTVPTSSFVTVKIYNSVGELIKTLTSKNYTVGTHNLIWNANNIASGVYFYHINAKGKNGNIYTNSKKMILLK